MPYPKETENLSGKGGVAMTNQELLDLFGEAKDIYILDAQKLRSGESGQKGIL